ncbi:GNAT family N-acetyltransferase [Kineobactrum sediminis]|uniref:GNAT family N-acetyltransferase n=2 Tax=Kineobactrum sediminis TaxID=1905677 RepID=A0A2N5Y598_9GAMM|nr:GNAT family N-acetyltransferase [Kineobactrum sediminis]
MITTPRLSIIPLTRSDAPFMLKLLNDPDFITHIADRGVRTISQAEQYLLDGPLASYREHGFGLWAVRVLERDELVGICGLVRRPQFEDIDIGYGFLPHARGQGYALEAAQGVFRYARENLGLKRVIAIVAPDNSTSITLLERLGFGYEASVRLQPDAEPICRYGWTAS